MNAVVIRPAAGTDITTAETWYETQSPGLGTAFLAELETAFMLIARNPFQRPCHHRNIRRWNLRRFPYGVFYVAKEERALVVAVLHASRGPRVLDGRIR